MRDEATIMLVAVLLGTVAAMPTTPEPDWAPTGRLSQFRGFVTPRPIPENAQMMYASVWAAWSAWSFCSNGVRMRVRACNTVRGFSCLGPNQETRPCDAILPPSGPNIGKTNTDYDIVDPWEQDRREAMKQLYPDEPSAPSDNSNFEQLSGAHPPGHRLLRPLPPAPLGLVDHELVGFEDRRPMNEADGSPGTDPEKLFGARQFAAKTLKMDERKEKKHKELSQLNQLVAMNSASADDQDEDTENLNSSSFEDITFDTTTLPPPTTTTSTTTTTTTTASTTTSTTTPTPTTTSSIPHKPSRTVKTGPRRGFGTTDKVSKELRLGEEIAKSFAEPHPLPSAEDKTAEVIDGSFEEAEVIGDHPVRVQPKLPPSAVDDNLEDLLEVAADEQPEIQTLAPRTTTLTPVRISAETEERDQPEISLPLAETDLLNSMRVKEERMEMKVVAPWNGKKKKKSFGITGFALRKSKEVKDEKAHILHDGQVAHFHIGPTSTTSTTTTTTTTEAPTTVEVERIEAEAGPEISTDTLNALDWMLKNMSQAAAKEDKEFLNQFVTDIGIPPRQQPEVHTATAEIHPSFPIQPASFPILSEKEQVSAAPVPPVKTKKAKTTGRKKSKKGKKDKALPKLHSGEFAPRSLLKKSKMFPKFKARAMKVMKTRALGVRTVSSDKDRVDVSDKEKLMAGVENPEQIYEEIRQLQAEMQQMEKQLSVLNSSEQKEASQTKSLNDPMISLQPSHGFGETKFVTKPENILTRNIIGSDPLRILSSMEQIIETKWSEWSEWGHCFCGKQLRTRNCIFGGNSDGCEGVSHESRTCSGGECPNESRSVEATSAEAPPPARTGVLNFNPSSLRSRPHRLP